MSPWEPGQSCGCAMFWIPGEDCDCTCHVDGKKIPPIEVNSVDVD